MKLSFEFRGAGGVAQGNEREGAACFRVGVWETPPPTTHRGAEVEERFQRNWLAFYSTRWVKANAARSFDCTNHQPVY